MYTEKKLTIFGNFFSEFIYLPCWHQSIPTWFRMLLKRLLVDFQRLQGSDARSLPTFLDGIWKACGFQPSCGSLFRWRCKDICRLKKRSKIRNFNFFDKFKTSCWSKFSPETRIMSKKETKLGIKMFSSLKFMVINKMLRVLLYKLKPKNWSCASFLKFAFFRNIDQITFQSSSKN